MIRLALIGLAVVAALVAGLAAALPWLAEPALRMGLRLAGLHEVDFDRLRLGWGEIELEGAVVGAPDHELERLRATYNLPDLLDGRLEQVKIDGLVVRARLADGRLQVAGFETAPGDDAGGLPPLPYADEIVVNDARFEVSTGFGEVALPLSATIRSQGERIGFTATGDARLTTGEGTLQARFALDGDLPQGLPIAIGEARASGTISIDSDSAALADLAQVDGIGTIAFNLDRGRLHASASNLALNVEQLAPAPWRTRLGHGRIELTAEDLPEAWHGTLSVEFADAGWSSPDLAVSGVSLRQQLDWAFAVKTLTLATDEAGSLRIESLARPDDAQAGPLQLRLEPGDPVLALAFEGGAPSWRVAWSGGIEAFEARIGAPLPLALESQAGTVTVALEGRGPALAQAHVSLADAQLRLPEHAVALDGITTGIGWTAAGLVDGETIPLTVRRISHAGKPAWFTPLALEGQLVPGPDRLAFHGTLSRIGGGLALSVRGEHQRASGSGGSGRATIELTPVTFGPDLQPNDLAPIVGDLLADVSGEVALSGDLAWSADRLDSDVALLVEAVALTAGPARLEQVNGVVRLDGLLPPTAPPGQQLAIGLLDLGLPLTEGVMTFALTPGPRLEVGQLTWHFAGGAVRAEPFTLGSQLEGVNVTLRAEQLDLASLFELTRLDGLTGEGSLDGALPVRLSEGAAIIENGELAATGPGVLRYRTEAAPAALRGGGEGVDLLLQALENFRYEVLKITLDGRTDAAMDIGLHLRGANPDLYDGYPIEFNLDLEGELGNILRQGVASFQIPDRIRERMQGLER